MIDLQALKEQLKLLGHDLPDSQVVAILKDMNIDFDNEADDGSAGRLAAPPKPEDGRYKDKAERTSTGLARTGSILDSFQEKRYQPSDAANEGVPSYNYGYTSAEHGAFLRHQGAGTGMNASSRGDQDRGSQHNGSQQKSQGFVDGDSDNEDFEEPGISCRYCTTAEHTGQASSQCPSSASGRLCVHLGKAQGAQSDLASPPDPGRGTLEQHNGPHAMMRPSLPPDDLSESLRGMSLRGPSADGPSARALDTLARGSVNKTGPAAQKAPSTAPVLRSASAGAMRDQQPKAVGMRQNAQTARGLDLVDCEERDDLFEPDKDPLGLGASLQEIMFMQQSGAWAVRGNTRPAGAGAGGRPVLASAAAPVPYAGWLGGRGQPLDVHSPNRTLTHGELSPQASNHSCVSRASTRCSSASKASAKKVDRVQRYQQLQQEWSQNRFLKQGGGATHSTSRKPVNFHSHFASLHAAEEAERKRVLREARARTKKELGAATEAPTANRRDELRWQTRMRLKNMT